MVNCDGTSSSVIAVTKCTIPVNSLRVAPFMLPWGSIVYAKVVAFNAYGDSIESAVGSSNIIMTEPDAPVGLSEDGTFRG